MKEITPKQFKRSLELIIAENPNMTAKEIMAERDYDVACYEAYKNLENLEAKAIVKKLMTDRYYKIQYHTGNRLKVYLDIRKAWVDGEIYIDCIKSTISTFGGEINVRTNAPEMYQKWGNFVTGNPDMETVTSITKEEYENWLKAVDNLFNDVV